MNASTRVLFWEGLVLIVFAGLMLVFFKSATLYELVFPFVFGGLGLAGLAISLVVFTINWSAKKNETDGRRAGVQQTTKFGANAVLYTVIFLGVLIFANILANGHSKKIDMTFAKVNTLSDQTVTALKNIPADEPLEIVGFFKAGESKEFEQLTAKYRAVSKKVKSRVVDPDLHPEEVKRYAISQRGAVAVTCGDPEQAAKQPGATRCTGQTNVTMDVTEQGLTTAIVKTSAPQAGAVYFVEGHGEVPLDGTEERGYALIKKGLANENIELRTVVLLKTGKIPDDAKLLIIAGPTKKLPPEEISLLEKYLDQGGRLFVMIDPLTDTGLEPLLAKYGVVVQNDIIVDRQVRLFEGSVIGLDPIVVDYGDHEITKKFGQNPTLFHEARSLKLETKDVLPGAMAQPLLRTSAQSWGATDFSFMKTGGEPKMDPKTDIPGPLVLGAAVERTVGEGDNRKAARLVVIGDADFAGNHFVAQGFNADLFFNAINWLTGQEAYISIRPNTFAPDAITMTERDTALIFFASVFLMPQLVVMLGIGVAIRRRG
jgi:ABC-type uncharacterized transport system involved in gliding motility auxiliary subunit